MCRECVLTHSLAFAWTNARMRILVCRLCVCTYFDYAFACSPSRASHAARVQICVEAYVLSADIQTHRERTYSVFRTHVSKRRRMRNCAWCDRHAHASTPNKRTICQRQYASNYICFHTYLYACGISISKPHCRVLCCVSCAHLCNFLNKCASTLHSTPVQYRGLVSKASGDGNIYNIFAVECVSRLSRMNSSSFVYLCENMHTQKKDPDEYCLIFRIINHIEFQPIPNKSPRSMEVPRTPMRLRCVPTEMEFNRIHYSRAFRDLQLRTECKKKHAHDSCDATCAKFGNHIAGERRFGASESLIFFFRMRWKYLVCHDASEKPSQLNHTFNTTHNYADHSYRCMHFTLPSEIPYRTLSMSQRANQRKMKSCGTAAQHMHIHCCYFWLPPFANRTNLPRAACPVYSLQIRRRQIVSIQLRIFVLPYRCIHIYCMTYTHGQQKKTLQMCALHMRSSI